MVSNSRVFIKHINPLSLILATALSSQGVSVLMVDEKQAAESAGKEYPPAEKYSRDFLEFAGFRLGAEKQLSATDIEIQALDLLAKKLSSTSWDTALVSANDTLLTLKKGEEISRHQTEYIVDGNNLDIAGDFEKSVLHIALYYWKILFFLKGQLSAETLAYHQKEKDLLTLSLKQQQRPSIIAKWKQKLRLNPSGFALQDSKINLHLSQFRNIEAGVLLPDLKVFDEKEKKYSSLRTYCQFGKLSLMMFGLIENYNLINTANWVRQNYDIELFYFPPSENNEELYKTLNIFEGEKKTIIVRPDLYIGMINERVDIEIIDNYLSNVLKVTPKRKAFET